MMNKPLLKIDNEDEIEQSLTESMEAITKSSITDIAKKSEGVKLTSDQPKMQDLVNLAQDAQSLLMVHESDVSDHADMMMGKSDDSVIALNEPVDGGAFKALEAYLKNIISLAQQSDKHTKRFCHL